MLLVEFLGTGNVDLGNGWSLLHDHDQDVAVGFQADVLEEAGRVQGLDRRGCPLLRDLIADLDRQIREHRAGLGALNALDANVLDLEVFKSEGGVIDEARYDQQQ